MNTNVFSLDDFISGEDSDKAIPKPQNDTKIDQDFIKPINKVPETSDNQSNEETENTVNEESKEQNTPFKIKKTFVDEEKKSNEIANEKYSKIIEENPKELFSTVNQEVINKWQQILIQKLPKEKNKNEDNINEDCLILTTDSDIDNLRIVMNDIPRTRPREKMLLSKDSFNTDLQHLISYYCKKNDIKYKQGLNEIIAPFILLKYKIPYLPLSDTYHMFTGFINLFAPNYYFDKNCYSLKNSLHLLAILMKYHSPILHNLFEKLMISPEMYGTNYLLTVFAGKLKIDILYYLWDELITENDPLMVHFLIVAFFMSKRELFLESDFLMVPVVITLISIDSIEEMEKIYKLALNLRNNTPYSFRKLANMLEIFKIHCENPKKIFEKYKPDTFPAMPIFPSEIFYVCYNESTKCPDDDCKNCSKNIGDNYFEENNTNKKKLPCEHCDLKIKKDFDYILLDLRILENGGQDAKTGILPMMIKIEQKLLQGRYLTDTLNERFNKDKGKSHFIFMTYKTDNFNELEDNYYIEQTQESNRFTVQLKADKEINHELYDKMSVKDKRKLKEYDNMKKLIECLLENNYPYISYIYGGFETIHDEIQEYNKSISLLNHDAKCELCLKKRKKNSKWISNKIKQVVRQSKTLYDNISNNITNNINIMKNKEKEKNKININELSNGDTTKNNSHLNNGKKYRNSLPTIPSHLIKKFMTVNEVTELVTNNEYNAKSCSLMEYNDKEYSSDNQGIIIIQKYTLLMLKFTNVIKDKMEIIDKFQLKFITDVKIVNKFYVNIYYLIDNEKNSLAIKFETEQETKNFFYEITQARKIYKK